MLVHKELDPEEVKRLNEVAEKKAEEVSVLCLLTHCELTSLLFYLLTKHESICRRKS
jgi:hypothetical protein